jgi:hypothetical protein
MYDTEHRVQADFDAKTELLKGEIIRVRGSLNTDCLSFEGMRKIRSLLLLKISLLLPNRSLLA